MKTELKVFGQIFIKRFYSENASFFLVVIGLGGGFMSGAEHKALAEFFISSPGTTLIPVFIWILYAIKIINFNAITTQRKENEFLFKHSLYPSIHLYQSLVFVLFNQLAPAFLYALFLSVTAIRYGSVVQLIIIATGLFLIIVLSTVTLKYRLSHPNAERKVWFIARAFNKIFVRPYPMFVIEWISRKTTFLLVSTMAFCSLLLFGVLMLYTTEEYDFRLLQMALVIAVSGNIQLICEIHRFETMHFSIIGQQPLSFLKRVAYLLPVIIFISLPQGALLLHYFPSNLDWVLMIECVGFMIGYSLFLYGVLYRKQQTQEQIMRFTFGCALLLFVLTLFSLPAWIITIVSSAIGLYIWKRNFYTFEIGGEKENN